MGEATTKRYPVTLHCTGANATAIYTAGRFLSDNVDHDEVVTLFLKIANEHCDDDMGKAMSMLLSLAIAVMDSADRSTQDELRRINLQHGGMVVKLEMVDADTGARVRDEKLIFDYKIDLTEDVRKKLGGRDHGYFRATIVPGVGFCLLEPVEGHSW